MEKNKIVMKKIILYLFMILSINSCSTQTKNEIMQIIENDKIEWVNSWKHNPLSNLTISDWKPIVIEYSYLYEKEDTYELFYSYSPSKIIFVDVYSRTIDIEIEENDTLVVPLDAEAEIILFDSIKKTMDRIFFVSDGTYFEDVIWITDNCFIVLGTCYEQGEQPVIMVYNIENMNYMEYKGLPDKKKYNYIERKFMMR
jgi:hypothetical protein